MNTTDRILGEATTQKPQQAVNWAIKYGQRFPEAESVIATSPGWAYKYALDVLKRRWPEGEAAIVKDPYAAYLYAKDVIRGRWPEAEAIIATSPPGAYLYAKDVIGGRWPEGEAAIVKDPANKFSKLYLKDFTGADADARVANKLKWVMNGWLDWIDWFDI